MKKLVSVILMIVLMIVGGSAIADTNDGIFYGIDENDAEEIMKEYAELRGYIDHLNRNNTYCLLYGLGAICIEDFVNDSGMEWSIENFNKWSMKDFNIVEMYTNEIETIDGIKIYRTQAQSETTPLGYKNEQPFYCADVIFMVFSLNNYYE